MNECKNIDPFDSTTWDGCSAQDEDFAIKVYQIEESSCYSVFEYEDENEYEACFESPEEMWEDMDEMFDFQPRHFERFSR